ncbi:hypothetical protein CesoFtcFv8_000667 [Champsocephalus esox]|uniref:Uncharacterized protein n=1 Tax=Champsocephalus esox TaxID=159716 RepID=A0AAN8D6T7_9TELE|nr:hypothetical protein CesoFtcFv8_000667 [Champsocephalus esox]
MCSDAPGDPRGSCGARAVVSHTGGTKRGDAGSDPVTHSEEAGFEEVKEIESKEDRGGSHTKIRKRS